MEQPTITREIHAETERRMTGGPDAVAAFELIPVEHRGTIEQDPQGAVEALWSSWLDLTVKLQGLGFTPRTLCDAGNTAYEVRTEKVGSEAHQRA
jgi:hypothetical protein